MKYVSLITKLPAAIIFICLTFSCTTENKNNAGGEMEGEAGAPAVATPATYGNERFRDVKVEKTGEGNYRITGKAQVFEATFSWVVEDGHNELASGFDMTDAGAPEFGNFDFTVNVTKQRENSTLHLVLFESSPEDGRRTYELPVLLE